ncbi:hypothetical protein [Olleya sp. R77988]|uniref:hypothetical protein n=1 Tax=Olleya sp. R77988 TaxID=3093875 RepID=UPI0037C8913E
MKTSKLTQLIKDSKPLFSIEWLLVNDVFFQDEYLQKFSKQLIDFHENNTPKHLPLPHFSEEITPDLNNVFSIFKSIIIVLDANNFISNKANQNLISNTIQKTPFESVLQIMGQRQTPATIKTSQGLPLKKQEMIDSGLKPYNNQISVGVRAWEKHIDRTDDAFWGKISGSPQVKQNTVKNIITNIINNHTWWNTFYHYKHQTVFEIRVKSGHGMRWSKEDKSLIGFLEPFL